MKKRVLFLGMMVSLSWNAMGIDSDVLQAFENHAYRISLNKKGVESNSERLDKVEIDVDALREDSIQKIKEIDHNSKYNKYLTEVNGRNINLINEETEANTKKIEETNLKVDNNTTNIIKNKENSETALATAKENTANIAGNKENLEKNRSSITAINEELDEHKVAATQRDKDIQDSVAKLEVTDKELKATDAKVNTAIDNLKETDKNLQATDTKLAQTDENLKGAVTTLEEHHDAVYETIGTTRDANATTVKVVKADTNRDMILALQDGSAKAVEEANVKVETNTINIAKNTEKIEYNSRSISNNSERIGSLEGKVDGLETEMKKGFAMSAAMSSIDFQILDVGDAGFGFGVGNYKNSEAVSLGVGVRPTENMTLNLKGAMSTGKGQETMVGGGAVYKFNLFGG